MASEANKVHILLGMRMEMHELNGNGNRSNGNGNRSNGNGMKIGIEIVNKGNIPLSER